MKVAEILKEKGRAVMTVRPGEKVETLAHRLRMAGIGALVVTEGEDHPLGLVAERDIVHAIAEHGGRALSMRVADIMTRRPVTCRPEDSVARVARIMTERRVRHVPVVEDGRLVGLVSIGDVVKHRIAEMELEAGVLRDIAIAGH